VFIGQSIYVPNALNNSLIVFSPGKTSSKIVDSGCLHVWTAHKHDSVGSARKPRKPTSRLPERSARKQNTSAGPKVTQPTKTVMMWLPRKVHRVRGLFNRPATEPKAFVDSIARHVEVIQNEGLYTSAFQIYGSTKGGRKNHTLVFVQANGIICIMKGIDLLVVLHMMKNKSNTPTYKKKSVLFSEAYSFSCWCIQIDGFLN
jgi:hypothetical protein